MQSRVRGLETRRAGALLLALAALAGGARADGPRAGAAAVAIAPPAGVPLAGYGARGPGNRSAGALAPVEARALVVEGAGGAPRVGIVALDALIVLPALREAVAARTRELALDALVVAATHTHAGPGGYAEPWIAQLVVMGWHDPAAQEAVAAASTRALGEASARLAPARLGAAVADGAGLAANRRPGGGPSDPAVPVLVVDGERGAIATLFALAAHPTVLSPANDRLHPDYPGFARARIEAERGGVALFLAGPLGDQKPHLAGEPEWPDEVARQVETARRLGEALAARVLAAARSATPIADARVAFASAAWELPPIDVRASCAFWVGAPLLSLLGRAFFPERAPLVAIRLGGLRVFASPLELGVEVAAALRARAPAGGPLLIAAHANDWLGYLLMPEDWDRGGYEPCLAYHGRELAPRFLDEAARILASLP